jgi:STE24 endopeptidase
VPPHSSLQQQAYGRAKAKFSFVSQIFNQIKSLAVLYFNVYPIVWGVAGTVIARYAPVRFSGEITQSLLFMYMLGWIDLLYGLPFSYYHSFVLEEKFGFNKMTVKLWLSDMAKGQGLAIAFGIPIGSAFLSIINKTGQGFFYYLWMFMLVVQISAMTIYPILIVPIFNKLEPLKPGKLKDSVEALASKLEFPLSELQVIDGSKRSAHSNAYFTGLPWIGKKKIVIYDTLLEKSTEKEVEAVLAHELGHWQMNHTSRLLFIGQAHMFYIFSLFSVFINNRSLYADFGFVRERPTMVGFILFNEILSPTDSIIKLLLNIWTRRMEYEAGMCIRNNPNMTTLTLRRCVRCQAWLRERARCFVDQAANPEFIEHGRRLVLLQLPPLPPNSYRAPEGYELDRRQEDCGGQGGRRGEAIEGRRSGALKLQGGI